MIIYASTDTSSLFGLLVLLCKQMTEKEHHAHRVACMEKLEFFTSNADDNDDGESVIKDVEGDDVRGNVSGVHVPSSCCPSFLSTYDNVITTDAMYDMNDDDDDDGYSSSNKRGSLRGMVRSLGTKMKEMWHDACDDIFLNFGDFLVNHKNKTYLHVNISEETIHSY